MIHVPIFADSTGRTNSVAVTTVASTLSCRDVQVSLDNFLVARDNVSAVAQKKCFGRGLECSEGEMRKVGKRGNANTAAHVG